MRRFAFEAVDASGARRSGIETAPDERALDRQLTKRGLVLLRARTARTSGRVTPRTLIDLFYHLSVILGSGVPILQGLRDLQEAGEHPLAAELADIEHRVEGGTSLSAALADHPRYFQPLSISLVRAGEQTGRLDAVLRDLVAYLEWRENFRRQVRSATTYPTIVFLGVVGLCGILGFFVLPRFTGIFGELGVEIPPAMRAMVVVRDLVVTGWPWLLAAAALLGAALWAWQRTEEGRSFRDRTLLRVPLVGRLILSLEFSRFCHNLSVLYSAGLPLLDALLMTADIVQNRSLRRAIQNGTERVQAGAGLREGLQPERVFPSMVLRMLHVGESTGQLSQSLEHVAQFYDREVPETIQRSITWFNAGVLVFMGATVAMIALSFFVPLYEMLGNVNAN